MFLCVPRYLWVCNSQLPMKKKIESFQVPVMVVSLPKGLCVCMCLTPGGPYNWKPSQMSFIAWGSLLHPDSDVQCVNIHRDSSIKTISMIFFPFHFSSPALLSTDTVSQMLCDLEWGVGVSSSVSLLWICDLWDLSLRWRKCLNKTSHLG